MRMIFENSPFELINKAFGGEEVNISKNITIHLSEDDVKEIVAGYIKHQNGYSVAKDNVILRVGTECRGYGRAEHDVTVFKGCDVEVKEV